MLLTDITQQIQFLNGPNLCDHSKTYMVDGLFLTHSLKGCLRSQHVEHVYFHLFRNFKIQENNNKLGENLSIQTTSTPVKPASTSSKGNHKSFEMNPARNRVLATADNIRRILRSLKAGGHLPMGSTNKKQIQVKTPLPLELQIFTEKFQKTNVNST